MIQLTDKHFEKLAIITDTPLEKIIELNSLGILDEIRTLELLIRYDWKLLKRTQPSHLVRYRIEALASFYNVSTKRVQEAVYHKSKNGYYCTECGRKLTKVEYHHGHGLCKECAIKRINENL